MRKQQPTLDIDSHPQLNRIVDESRLEKGTCSVYHRDRALSVMDELSCRKMSRVGNCASEMGGTPVVHFKTVILSGIGPFAREWADEVEGPLAAVLPSF